MLFGFRFQYEYGSNKLLLTSEPFLGHTRLIAIRFYVVRNSFESVARASTVFLGSKCSQSNRFSRLHRMFILRANRCPRLITILKYFLVRFRKPL